MKGFEIIYETCVGNAISMKQISLEEYNESRTERATDARVLAVGWLTGYGYTEADICRLSGWKQQRVNYLKNLAVARLNRRIFCKEYQELTEEMRKML